MGSVGLYHVTLFLLQVWALAFWEKQMVLVSVWSVPVSCWAASSAKVRPFPRCLWLVDPFQDSPSGSLSISHIKENE